MVQHACEHARHATAASRANAATLLASTLLTLLAPCAREFKTPLPLPPATGRSCRSPPPLPCACKPRPLPLPPRCSSWLSLSSSSSSSSSSSCLEATAARGVVKEGVRGVLEKASRSRHVRTQPSRMMHASVSCREAGGIEHVQGRRTRQGSVSLRGDGGCWLVSTNTDACRWLVSTNTDACRSVMLQP